MDSTSQLPEDLPFYRLLPNQKDSAQTWYVGLTQADEPPYPLNGPRPLFMMLRSLAKKQKVSGELALEVVVAANGRAKEVKVIKSPSVLFGRYAANAARRWNYSPGLCQSLPCEMSYPVAIRIY